MKPTVEQIKDELERLAAKYDLDAAILTRQCEAESAFNPDAVSKVGAIGLMQLMPATAKELGVDPKDWRQNLEGGAKYLRNMLNMFGGRYRPALAAYNWGPGNVRKAIRETGQILWESRLPRETKGYLVKIIDANRKV
jgi:soluble lytic murein transglycosylase-like protein